MKPTRTNDHRPNSRDLKKFTPYNLLVWFLALLGVCIHVPGLARPAERLWPGSPGAAQAAGAEALSAANPPPFQSARPYLPLAVFPRSCFMGLSHLPQAPAPPPPPPCPPRAAPACSSLRLLAGAASVSVLVWTQRVSPMSISPSFCTGPWSSALTLGEPPATCCYGGCAAGARPRPVFSGARCPRDENYCRFLPGPGRSTPGG